MLGPLGYGDSQELEGRFWGVPVERVIIFEGLYWGPVFITSERCLMALAFGKDTSDSGVSNFSSAFNPLNHHPQTLITLISSMPHERPHI